MNASNPEEKIDPENYFAVRAWLWNADEGDHTTEIKQHPALKVFAEFLDAEKDYLSLSGKDFPDAKGQDLRMELTHFRFGDPHLVRTQIIFP